MACGEIGTPIKEYYKLTKRQVFNIIKGYNNRQLLHNKISWEQTRIIAYYNALPYFKKAPTIEKFLPFEWDKKEVKKVKRAIKSRKQMEKLFCENK